MKTVMEYALIMPYNINIIIPTCKSQTGIKPFLRRVEENISEQFNVMPTCFHASAATNRNFGLNIATSEIVIMMDDDIKGFFPGWADELIKPLLDRDGEEVIMVSARLMQSKTKPGVMMNISPDLSVEWQLIAEQLLPSACIAFRKDDTRFDEAYLGSGWEDTDFCYQLNEKYPEGKYLINNNVELIHKNEMKNQMNTNFLHNKYYFKNKWNINENS